MFLQWQFSPVVSVSLTMRNGMRLFHPNRLSRGFWMRTLAFGLRRFLTLKMVGCTPGMRMLGIGWWFQVSDRKCVWCQAQHDCNGGPCGVECQSHFCDLVAV
jgi:hypothetical protein